MMNRRIFTAAPTLLAWPRPWPAITRNARSSWSFPTHPVAAPTSLRG